MGEKSPCSNKFHLRNPLRNQYFWTILHNYICRCWYLRGRWIDWWKYKVWSLWPWSIINFGRRNPLWIRFTFHKIHGI